MISPKVLLSYCAAFFVLVIVYGVIPFRSISDPGEIVWLSGFADSFVNSGWSSLKATNFGIPAPVPLPFGLARAVLQGVFIWSFKLHAVDAYSLALIIWLFLALLAFAGLRRMLG